MSLVINLRGTNGSGKTTVMRQVMAQASSSKPNYALLGFKKPEAYRMELPGVKEPVYVLGPYITDTGGVDLVQPYDNILVLLDKYIPRGHVLFEGVLVSSSNGRVGRYMEALGPERAVMCFFDTTREQCIANVQKRRASRDNDKQLDPKNLTLKYNQVVRSYGLIKATGRVRVVDININTGAETVLSLLRAAG